jgi:predicted O-methyltransferase YrrM
MEPRTLEVIEQIERFMETVDDALPLPRLAAEFVHGLVIATDARRAVEIGTSYGYSGLWIAAALAPQNGRLITIDKLDRKTNAARVHFEAAGLLSSVEFITGHASEVLASIEGPIDFVLNDADKENCIRYVELLLPRLSDRAIVLTDNTITHRTELAEFVNWIRSRPDFVSVGVPVGNGMEMSVKYGE